MASVSEPKIILDTGPIIALLNGNDPHHKWVCETWGRASPPMLVCEAVLTEAFFLARRLGPGAQEAVLQFVERGALQLSFSLVEEWAIVGKLLRKYQDTPMSLADGFIVRMAEQHPRSTVVTLAGDLAIYRKHVRQRTRLLSPASA